MVISQAGHISWQRRKEYLNKKFVLLTVIKIREVVKKMNRLRKVRKEKGYTLAAAAIVIGIANNTLSQYETGKREPKLETWQRLADFYGVSVSYLQGIDKEIYSLNFPTKQEAIDFIHKIMKAQNIRLEDIK